MNAKLHGWIENSCQAQADGTWLVDVYYFSASSKSTYILPNIEVKSEYVRRAMRAGLLRLLTVSVVVPLELLAVTFVELRRATGGEFSVGQAGQSSALLCLVIFIGAIGASEGALRRWLNQVGMVADTQHAQSGTARLARSTAHWPIDLFRHRPTWMVAFEMFAVGLLMWCMGSISLAWRSGCRAALEAAGSDRGSWTFWPANCAGFLELLFLFFNAVILASALTAWWDWWRWHRRDARA